MQFAITSEGDRVKAKPYLDATCPCCDSQVIPKCGNVNVWHWSHKNISDCDSWSEGETEWHSSWKDNFLFTEQEVVMKPHRADIYCNGKILELQHSPLDPYEARERERFYSAYGKMVWLWDLTEQHKNENFVMKKDLGNKTFTFRWKHPNKTVWCLREEVFLDLSYCIFKIGKVYQNIPCGGYGKIYNKSEFLDYIKRGNPYYGD